jgi:hypothetical protein
MTCLNVDLWRRTSARIKHPHNAFGYASTAISRVSGLRCFHRLVPPATFWPTECLMAPALCLPCSVCGGDDSLARDSVLTRMKSSSVNRTNDIAKACR